jgi:hypothetical protein
MSPNNPILALFERIIRPARPLPTGIYHYDSTTSEGAPFKLHLRIEPDANAVLILNAHTILHLNQTAAEYAYHLVKQTSLESACLEISKRYRVSAEQARDDFNNFKEQITQLLQKPDLDPQLYFGFEHHMLYSSKTSAPYRLDCALTYQVRSDSSANLAPTDRVKRNLETFEWKAILDKAWCAGIPQAVFTGGEPTLRSDLPALIQHTEELGMVSGLITDGLAFNNKAYLNKVLQCGLDHLMFVLQPENEEAWQALSAVMAEDIFCAVHLTLTQDDLTQFSTVLERLSALGVKSLSISSDETHQAVLPEAKKLAAEKQFNLVWDLPVPYYSLNPVTLEIARDEEAPQGAGTAWLYLEPDGDVLPAQGQYEEVLGNFLNDPWEQIWRHCNGVPC